jgi:hypothetical protein
VTQNINIALTGFEGGGDSNSTTASPVRITTKDILADLGAATGTSVSSRSKLVATTALGGGTAFVIHGGGGTNGAGDVDVSSLIGANTLSQVQKVKSNPNGTLVGTSYSITTFSLGSAGDTNGAGTKFFFPGLQAFTTTSLANGAFNSSVNGAGTVDGNPAVVKGSITGSAGKLQIVPSQ